MTTNLFPYQEDGLIQVERFGGRALVAWEMGLGKAQPLSARVLSPTGWRLMGDLQIGDFVISPNGTPTKVIAIFPQGLKKIFRVTFTDGASTRCCNDHLWAVRTPIGRWKKGPYKVLPLNKIRQKIYDNHGNKRHFIPITEPIQYPNIPTKLDPYLVGYLIANGSLSHGTSITIPDKETAIRIESLLPPDVKLIQIKSKRANPIGYSITRKSKQKENSVKAELQKLGLFGKRSWEKSIPKDYLFNSIDSRISLLQGLMDGDGYISKKGDVSQYYSSSEQLASDVRCLIESLGGVCKLEYNPDPHFTYRGERRVGRPHYTLTIILPNEVKPFRLSRKIERWIPRTKYLPYRAIKSVEEEEEEELCQCITVENQDGLYLTDHHIVTHNSILSLSFLHRHPEIERALVICPASAKWHWQYEASFHLNIQGEVLSTRKPPRKKSLLKKRRLLIINYDILAWWKEWLIGDPLKRDDLGYNPDLIIIDECHYLQNRNSGRTIATRAVCKDRKHVLALSGTPLINRPSELWPTLNILRPEIYKHFYPYAMRHCGPRKKPWGWTFDGASNLNELHSNLLHQLMIRKRKIEVLADLPEKMLNVIPLPVDNLDDYESARDDYLSWIRNNHPGMESTAAKAERITQIGHLKRLAAQGKLKYAIEWIENFLNETDEKLLVFGIHIKILDQIQEKFRKICTRVDGSVTGEKRQHCFNAFNNDKKIRLFLGNIDAAGVIWSCRSSSNVAFVELPWSPAKVNQAIDRVHGVGRGIPGHPVSAWFLVAKETTEERLCSLLQRKQAIHDAIVDGNPTVTDFNLFDKLTEALQQERTEHESERTLL